MAPARRRRTARPGGPGEVDRLIRPGQVERLVRLGGEDLRSECMIVGVPRVGQGLGEASDVLLLRAAARSLDSAFVPWPDPAVRGNPWIGLPSGGIHVVGQIERDVRGVLVVENTDAFQYVCLRPDVTDTWLCVWGRGSTTDGAVDFLKTMNDLPIAAWCDLDARGVEIVTELAGRLDREITPVGMGVELFVGGKQYVPKNLAESLKVAKKMTADGHPALRDVAKAIVASGGLGSEQETLCDVVPPTLARDLAKLE